MPNRRPLNVSSPLQQPRNNELSESILVPLLVARSYHLPGNGWCADWVQWFRNNHILFGICLRHRLHPLEGWERCLLLASSISFGLVATNLVYQLDITNAYDASQELVNVYDSYKITHGMVLLWTFGGVFHSLFDMLTWHIMACAICHPGGRWGDTSQSKRFRDCGSYALIPLILALLAFAAFLVLLRATEEGKEEDDDDDVVTDDDGINTNGLSDIRIRDWRSFAFLSKYAIEIALAWFIYFPLIGTILFSGILGCNGRLPILGGRPRDMRLVQEGRFSQAQDKHQNTNEYARF